MAGDVIEILDYGSGIASFTQRAYSAAVSVVDSTSPGVLAVGAVDPAASGTIGSFSSEGPTNDGRIIPAIAAPSGFTSTVFGFFRGTSASAAVVSGGAALMLDASMATDPSSLGSLIRHLAIDRGPAGPDNLYGYGEFRLPTPPDGIGVDDTPSRFVGLNIPTRLLDTRPATAVGPAELIGRLNHGEILDLPVSGIAGVPASGVTAVAVNIVTVQPDGVGYLQALPTLEADLGSYSNVNTDGAGQTRSNFAIVPIGDGGRISIYSAAGGNVVVDLLGWFEATTGAVTGGRFVELPAAQRLFDSRTAAPGPPAPWLGVQVVNLPAGVDPTLIDSLVVTITATGATSPGWLQAKPDSVGGAGTTSTINIDAGGSVANTAIVPIVAGQRFLIVGSFADNGGTHVIVDAVGYITSGSAPSDIAGRFVAVEPNRAFDSRTTETPLPDGQVVSIDASMAPGVTIPANAGAVVWNLAVVRATRWGYLRGWAAVPANRPRPR